jgi:hypothetical protein
MPGPLETHGSIEVFCSRADVPASRRSMFSFDSIIAGERLALCFHSDEDMRPPYSLKLRAPNGALIIDRILRELPTGLPQSAPPIEFIASAPGAYAIEVRELSGTSWGTATLTVASS